MQGVEKLQWESREEGGRLRKRGRSRQNGRENGRDLSSSLLRGAPVSLPAQSQSSVRALLRISSRSSARKPLAPTRDPPEAPPPSPSLHTTHLRTSPPAPPRPPVFSSTLYKQSSASPLPGHRSKTATSVRVCEGLVEGRGASTGVGDFGSSTLPSFPLPSILRESTRSCLLRARNFLPAGARSLGVGSGSSLPKDLIPFLSSAMANPLLPRQVPSSGNLLKPVPSSALLRSRSL